VPQVVVAKRAVIAVRQLLSQQQRQQRPLQLGPKRPQKAALTTWTTIFRFRAKPAILV
jgi:hypothetical protein